MTMPQLAGAASGGGGHYAAAPVDRLVRKEVALGSIRERSVPDTHIGLGQIAPFLNVATDDVIFDYLGNNLTEGLAPARAEDAEAELAQKDTLTGGTGRASVIDWALKDEYSASDVTRFRDSLMLQALAAGQNGLSPLAFQGDPVADFRARVARDDARRRRSLDNRMEWLIMQAVENGVIAYNDGKIKFTVDYGRPANQQNQTPASGLWTGTDFDPVGDIKAVNRKMFDTWGVRCNRVIGSKRALETMWKSSKFLQVAGGLAAVSAAAAAPGKVDLNYLLPSWDEQAAIAAVERATGVRFIPYDGIYRTRTIGSKTFVNNRFLSDNKLYFLPEEADLGDVDQTAIGFAKTLTAPHPEGLWTPGYYEWEMDKQDPWQTVRGTGIKAFPVFPFMEYTYSMTVL